MDPITQQVVLATAGAAGAGDATYVDDVFSTFLYEGTNSTQSINNGIDLSGEGGLVWIKNRDANNDHNLYDTERGAAKRLRSNTNDAEQSTETYALQSFNSNGFTLGANWSGENTANNDIASWTFRKAPGFFDVVTWTGNGTSGRTISHNLGSVPGMIIVKASVNGGGYSWAVWHRSLSSGKTLFLNTDGRDNTQNYFPSQPTATNFTISNSGQVNSQYGFGYVAYIFAHDDQSFGTDSDEAIIKCGSYNGTGSSGNTVNLGFEPQWMLIKQTNNSRNWVLVDNMRGVPTGGSTAYLQPNINNAENTGAGNIIDFTATGFELKNPSALVNGSSGSYIYMAIRRPHKPPTAETDVFAIDTSDATSPSPPQFTSGFVTDFIIRKTMNGGNNQIGSRLQGINYMSTYNNTAEGAASALTWDFMDGWSNSSGVDSNLFCYMLKRAPGFFDVVAYTGTGSLPGVTHNLGVTPELKIIKCRDSSGSTDFFIGGSALAGLNYGFMRLNTDGAAGNSPSYWAAGSDSATTFSVRNNNTQLDFSGRTYIAYLFASLSGISKVGSYSGTGNDINVNCGFTAGARFVLIKRTDSSGDWYVYDTTNGIVSGNDPYWITNDAVAAVTNTDYIDPLNVGFTVTSSAPAALNASGGTYLFLAIA